MLYELDNLEIKEVLKKIREFHCSGNEDDYCIFKYNDYTYSIPRFLVKIDTIYESTCKTINFFKAVMKNDGDNMCGDNDDRYKHGNIECIEALRSCLSEDEFRGFCKGNVIKYLWRSEYKGGKIDVIKAKDYLDYLLKG